MAVPLVGYAFELALVVRVRLDAQARGEHKLADGGAEAGKEGVEGLGGTRVSEFDSASDNFIAPSCLACASCPGLCKPWERCKRRGS